MKMTYFHTAIPQIAAAAFTYQWQLLLPPEVPQRAATATI